MPIVKSGYALFDSQQPYPFFFSALRETYLVCNAVMFMSKSDMPLLTNAETAKNAPVQKGDNPFERDTSG